MNDTYLEQYHCVSFIKRIYSNLLIWSFPEDEMEISIYVLFKLLGWLLQKVERKKKREIREIVKG